jgi:hypothetical protein
MTDAAPVAFHDAVAAVAAAAAVPPAAAAAPPTDLSSLEPSDFSENLDLEQGLAVVRAMTALSDGPGSPLIIRNAYLRRMLQALINPATYATIVPGLQAAVATALNRLRTEPAVKQLVAAAMASADVDQVPRITLRDVECCAASRLVWSTLVPLAVADEAHTTAIAQDGSCPLHDFRLEVRDYKFVVGCASSGACLPDSEAPLSRRQRDLDETVPSFHDVPAAPPNAAAPAATAPSPSAGAPRWQPRGRISTEQWLAMTPEQRAAFIAARRDARVVAPPPRATAPFALSSSSAANRIPTEQWMAMTQEARAAFTAARALIQRSSRGRGVGI